MCAGGAAAAAVHAVERNRMSRWGASISIGLALVAMAEGFSAAAPAPAPSRSKALPPARSAAPAPPALVGIRVDPPRLSLSALGARQQLLVTGRFSDGVDRDVTDHAAYASDRPAIAGVDRGGRVTVIGSGEARVTVRLGKAVSAVVVRTAGAEARPALSFTNDVMPVLTRAGCNQGACHGAQHGKGGFKLSLLGYDPDEDYPVIARHGGGRRVVKSAPEQSLLLRKATLAIAHGGGRRMGSESPEYGLLAEWIGAGLPGPVADDVAVTAVEVHPAVRVVRLAGGKPRPAAVHVPQTAGAPRVLRLDPGLRLTALARFADGRTEDVTQKAQFNSLNDAVAGADPSGRVSVSSSGETGIMVRYRGQVAVARVTVPYRVVPAAPSPPEKGFVDPLVAARWRQMGLAPSGPCTDAEFMRRLYLDVLGILPLPDEIRAFVASGDVRKRERLIDAVLARPEYIDYWTLKWGDLLRNHRDKLGEKGMWSFYNWLRAAFRENKPMDRFASELITAQGSTFTNGPANYYRVARTPADLAETTAQVFLGIRLACAKCHHHPFEKWSQDDYHQMAAFFARVDLKGSEEFGIFGGEQVVWVRPSGEVNNPRSGKQMAPTPLDGKPSDDPVDRRRALAQWLTGPDNLLFARSIVNRYWGYLMGRGIVEPIDDMRVSNPPSNPELLDALARDFIKHRYDLKHLIRTIVTSRVYQLSSNPTLQNKPDEVFFTKYTAKRMGAEELLDALVSATGAREKFPNLPAGVRAVQLPDPGVASAFLDVFGRPERQITCECERSPEPNMAQALHLMNGDYLQNKIAAPEGRIAKLLAAKKSDDEIVEELYLVTFSRTPTPDEITRARLSVLASPNKKEGFEDLLWALLNSREFLFKH